MLGILAVTSKSKALGNARVLLRHYQEKLKINRNLRASTYNNVGRGRIGFGQLPHAAEAFHQAIAVIDPIVSSNQPTASALYAAADAYTGLGDAESGLAKKVGPDRSKHYQQACASYQRSLDRWSALKEPGITGPWGFLSVPPADVSSRLARCKLALKSN